MSNSAVFAQVKLTGESAARIREEAVRRRLSQNALVTEYCLAGLADDGPDDDALAGVEKRMVATLMGVRSAQESTDASINVTAALLDSLIRLLLVSLPEPSVADADALRASAASRYQSLIRQAAEQGFDRGRPNAIRQIVRLLDQDETDAE